MIKTHLDSLATRKTRESTQKFFKTKPGDYSSHDVFIGVTTPVLRSLIKTYEVTPLTEISKLIKSKIHEHRSFALMLLVKQYQTAFKAHSKVSIQSALSVTQPWIDFYLEHLSHVNNWDLVDISASQLLGHHWYQQGNELKAFTFFKDFIDDDSLWKRRIAIVSTYYFIKQGRLSLTLKISKKLLNDNEDLIHKACGWMLREVGKKDMQTLKSFIDVALKKMPRTMLRYAIEKMSPAQRKHYLNA